MLRADAPPRELGTALRTVSGDDYSKLARWPLSRDHDLVVRSLDDPHAFDAVFEKHHAAIRRYVARRLSPSYADEVAADVFCIAFDQRARLVADRPDCPVGAWLYGIATNLGASPPPRRAPATARICARRGAARRRRRAGGSDRPCRRAPSRSRGRAGARVAVRRRARRAAALRARSARLPGHRRRAGDPDRDRAVTSCQGAQSRCPPPRRSCSRGDEGEAVVRDVDLIRTYRDDVSDDEAAHAAARDRLRAHIASRGTRGPRRRRRWFRPRVTVVLAALLVASGTAAAATFLLDSDDVALDAIACLDSARTIETPTGLSTLSSPPPIPSPPAPRSGVRGISTAAPTPTRRRSSRVRRRAIPWSSSRAGLRPAAR